MKYRLDIDGLRAIAVSSVVLFHINEAWLTGGFLGVDIFFVISGFLITGIIYEGLKQKSFSYAGFYERRIRRLYPALIAMLVLSCIAAAFIYDAQKMADFGGSAIHALFGLSNFFFYFNADYFDVEASSRPLLHTWSLAVEEQFYIFWPLLLLVIIKLPAKLRILALILLILASAAFGEWQVRADQSAAFYLLPARIAELAIGGLVAIMMKEFTFHTKVPNPVAAVIHVSCIALLIVFFIAYDESMLFPGLSALPPSIATALLLMFPIRGPLSYFLNNPVFRWIGLISYSAYLVHWPAIVFYKAWKVAPLTLTEEIGLAVFTVAAGSLFYWLVETPFRAKHGQKPFISNSGLAFFTSLSLIGVVLYTANAWTGSTWVRVPRSDQMERIEAHLAATQGARGAALSRDECHQGMRNSESNFDRCMTLESEQTNLLVLGSSFAGDDWLMLQHAYPDAHIQRLTTQSCPSFVPSEPHCELTHDYIFDHIDQINQFDAVIFAHNWKMNEDLSEMERLLDLLSTDAIVFGARGILNQDMLDVLRQVGADNATTVDTRYERPETQTVRAMIHDISTRHNAGYIDMYDLLRPEGELPFFASPEALLYLDYGHYSLEGGEFIAGLMREEYPDPQSLLAAANNASPPALIETGPANEAIVELPMDSFRTDAPYSFSTADGVISISYDGADGLNIDELASNGRPGIWQTITGSELDDLKGRYILVQIEARSAESGELHAAYTTNDNGNSRWQSFETGPDWQTFEFYYSVPEPTRDNPDVFALLPSVSVGAPSTDIRSITISVQP